MNNKKLLAILSTCLFGWACTYVATDVFGDYAFGLFIWLPWVMGVMSTLIFAYKNEVTRKTCRDISFASMGIYCIGLLFFAFEGIICMIMALPLGLLFNWLGYITGYEILNRNVKSTTNTLGALVISVPLLMGIEHISSDKEYTANPITTSIEINAPIETVWKNVIVFPQLDEPTEFLFNAGIAYPINAKIEGHGVGAVRYCNFSTGSFVEPITKWEEPTLLAFDVVDQPEPMKELSPYDIQPNHLHGYFVSKKGQFKLTKLSSGKTLLEGTTWYYNKIKPVIYWDIWSDFIIHKIHERVLKHIKKVSEVES